MSSTSPDLPGETQFNYFSLHISCLKDANFYPESHQFRKSFPGDTKHKSQNTTDFTQQLLFGCLTSGTLKKPTFFKYKCVINIKGKKHPYHVDIGKMSFMKKVFMNLLNGLAALAFGLGCSHGGIKRHRQK